MKKIVLVSILILVFISCEKKEINIPNMNNVSTSSPIQNIETENNNKKEENKNLQGYKLIQNSDCMSCHKDNGKMIGPSYIEIADRYNENDKNTLAQRVIEGSSGVWGQIPMSPHPSLSKEEVIKMVEYILSLKNNK